MISDNTTAGRTIALVRVDAKTLTGPGLEEAEPTFDELVLGYLDDSGSSPEPTIP